MFDDILCTHYILIYLKHNGDDAPQKTKLVGPYGRSEYFVEEINFLPQDGIET